MTTETIIAISFLLSNGHISNHEVQRLNLKPHELVSLQQAPLMPEEELPANLEAVVQDTYIKIKEGMLKDIGQNAAPTTDCLML